VDAESGDEVDSDQILGPGRHERIAGHPTCLLLAIEYLPRDQFQPFGHRLKAAIRSRETPKLTPIPAEAPVTNARLPSNFRFIKDLSART